MTPILIKLAFLIARRAAQSSPSTSMRATGPRAAAWRGAFSPPGLQVPACRPWPVRPRAGEQERGNAPAAGEWRRWGSGASTGPVAVSLHAAAVHGHAGGFDPVVLSKRPAAAQDALSGRRRQPRTPRCRGLPPSALNGIGRSRSARAKSFWHQSLWHLLWHQSILLASLARAKLSRQAGDAATILQQHNSTFLGSINYKNAALPCCAALNSRAPRFERAMLRKGRSGLQAHFHPPTDLQNTVAAKDARVAQEEGGQSGLRGGGPGGGARCVDAVESGLEPLAIRRQRIALACLG
jgi:hypothetical protein